MLWPRPYRFDLLIESTIIFVNFCFINIRDKGRKMMMKHSSVLIEIDCIFNNILLPNLCTQESLLNLTEDSNSNFSSDSDKSDRFIVINFFK